MKLINSSKDIFCYESFLKDLQKIELECYLLKNSQQNNPSNLELNVFVLNMLCKEKKHILVQVSILQSQGMVWS